MTRRIRSKRLLRVVESSPDSQGHTADTASSLPYQPEAIDPTFNQGDTDDDSVDDEDDDFARELEDEMLKSQSNQLEGIDPTGAAVDNDASKCPICLGTVVDPVVICPI
jgi:hypothetical protein